MILAADWTRGWLDHPPVSSEEGFDGKPAVSKLHLCGFKPLVFHKDPVHGDQGDIRKLKIEDVNNDKDVLFLLRAPKLVYKSPICDNVCLPVPPDIRIINDKYIITRNNG